MKTILLVEDDANMADGLMLNLEAEGYGAVHVIRGNDALSTFAEGTFDLILLDIMLPGMDGLTICRRLREAGETVPILFITARGQADERIEGLIAGGDDYIAKPFDNDELRARINVGRRIIGLQTTLAEKEKLQGVIEMAGAVCHEMNQPIQAISGFSELLMMDIEDDSPFYKKIKGIQEQTERMGEITKKLMSITKYETKDYLERKIVDIDRSSTERT